MSNGERRRMEVPRWVRWLIIGQLSMNVVVWLALLTSILVMSAHTESIREDVKHLENVRLELFDSRVYRVEVALGIRDRDPAMEGKQVPAKERE